MCYDSFFSSRTSCSSSRISSIELPAMALTVAATAPSTSGQSAGTSFRYGMDSSTISAVITAEPMSMSMITPSSE